MTETVRVSPSTSPLLITLGLNKERLNELEEESFLYFQEDQGEMEKH